MTENTPNPTYDLIQTIAQDMQESLLTPDDIPIETLRDQAKLLNHLHTQMIAEATPTGRPFDKRHDLQRLSLALRAQNQFCRTLLVMDHLSNKDDIANELSNPDIIK